MRDSKQVIVMGLMTALVSLSVGLMRDSRTILVIGLLIVLASLAGCAGKIRFPKYYVLNVPAPVVKVQPNSNLAIEVSLSARLISLRTGEVLWQDASSKRTNVDQHSVRGIVAEMSGDVGAAVEHLVSSVPGRLSAGALSVGGSTVARIGIENLKESGDA